MAKASKPANRFGDWLSNRILRGLIRLALALPYATRVRMMGWIMSRVIAPIAGYDDRIRANLAHVLPDLPEDEIRRLMREVPDNVGRTVIEIYSGQQFIDRVKDLPLTGDGAAALEQANADKRPVILVTGHFGNYDAPRGALIARGYSVGGLYNPMKNVFFNEHYENAIGAIGQPIFPRGRKGYAQMLRFIKGGGMVGIVVDQFMAHGEILDFFGQPAPTALSAAELALKYDALLVPIYGVRQPDGLNFELVVEAPIAHTDAATMTQALNDSLESLTRKHMAQWFWIHRRWKPEKQAKLAAKRARAAAKAEK
ncbi:lysophospholipid acyltransferase family protein [Actibacterium lipolyticum]|uniref:Lipid A biosynthesis lauroyl acyltransferase n=1 Tax=Actibacterium lipolyticum TaxID=1524263 RepID=A0A238KHZ5_9RHOB|nr:lysophospholipid acyltransferase family protein [Actibacterium lipolyticum]SMX42224.1 Lipid A biosynthesis lauroyl acyltransferase [Actibacterium lipolyticum]